MFSDDHLRFVYNYFEDGFDGGDVAEEHHRRVLHQINMRYQLRSNIDPFSISVNEFVNLYRIPQHLVLKLAGILAPHMYEGTCVNYIPKEIKVGVFLYHNN